jgi:hypothetical protein
MPRNDREVIVIIRDRDDLRQRITTRSGSVYVYDRDARTVTWAMPDGEERQYTAITDAVVHVGYPFVYAGTRDRCGKPMSRRTTPVVSIEEDPR